MKIRLLTEKDWHIWRALRLEALQNSPESLASSKKEEIEYSQKEWEDKLTKSDIFGAFIDNKLIAGAGFYRLNRLKTMHRGDLFAMYVMPEYRGQGIANQLIDVIINHAKSRVIQLHLSCVTNNESAVKLYQKHGFKIYGTEPRSLKIDDSFFDEHLMLLELKQIMIKPNITEDLVQKLIAEQFPEYAHLPIKPVKSQGHDNRTFRLGTEMLVRLPSGEEYVRQIAKEHKWLPLLAPKLPLPIPESVAMGKPSNDYPFYWSIYRWLEGDSANTVKLNDITMETMAIQLAYFLQELHKFDADIDSAPQLHNWWRAAHTSTYDEETRNLINKLGDLIDARKASSLWQKAISSKWKKRPVWVHGDVASGNILLNRGKLCAVIDFGCMGIGDPACDLTIAWTFFKNNSRQVFKNALIFDAETWDRARGWALWKAMFTLNEIEDKNSLDAIKQLQIINEVIDEKT